jgi:hypothetical protein
MGCTITIQYNAPAEFGKDKIEIKIQDTTYGALQVFNYHLKKISRPIKDTDSFTQIAYLDLLKQLTTELEKKLNSDL